jgi:pheophorbide a oxygenase
MTMSSVRSSALESFNQNALKEKPQFPRTWVPLASVYEIDGMRPNKVEFLGQSYVCYQSNADDPNGWTVVDDACPHRLAPLSEGRIITTDKDTNEIKINDLKNYKGESKRLVECAYHGWAFDQGGKCVRIPQATKEQQTRSIESNTKCHVQCYSTRVCKNILFAWLWPEDCLDYMHDDWRQPEYMTSSFVDSATSYTRDAQYGWDTLLENIVDLSHLPWVSLF